jgi:hypothetical protein
MFPSHTSHLAHHGNWQYSPFKSTYFQGLLLCFGQHLLAMWLCIANSTSPMYSIQSPSCLIQIGVHVHSVNSGNNLQAVVPSVMHLPPFHLCGREHAELIFGEVTQYINVQLFAESLRSVLTSAPNATTTSNNTTAPRLQ